MFISSRTVNLRRRLFLSEWQRSRYATCDWETEYLSYFSQSAMFIQGVLLIRDRSIDVSEHRVILWEKNKTLIKERGK